MDSFTDLKAWQMAHRVALDIYRLTRTFPADERFCLVTQMRRAAVSIPANIAEGYGRRSGADKAHMYTISHGSKEELKYYLLLARDLGYVADLPDLARMLHEVGAMLHGLIQAALRRPDEFRKRKRSQDQDQAEG